MLTIAPMPSFSYPRPTPCHASAAPRVARFPRCSSTHTSTRTHTRPAAHCPTLQNLLPQPPNFSNRSCQAAPPTRCSCQHEGTPRLQATSPTPAPTPSPSPSSASPVEAVHLAALASCTSSLLAAQCLVEGVLELYLSATSFSTVHLDLALLGARGQQGRSRSRAEPDHDTLSAWVALVMLTLEEMGVVQEGGQAAATGTADATAGSALSPDLARFLEGMRGFVRQTLTMHAGGYTLQRLQGLQGLVGGGGSGGVQGTMQHYTRLVLLTVEVVLALDLPRAAAPTSQTPDPAAGQDPEAADQDPHARRPSIVAPTGFTLALSPEPQGTALGRLLARQQAAGAGAAAGTGEQQQQQEAVAPAVLPSAARALAVRLLICFMGAAMDSHTSLQKFVHTTAAAYTQGWSAEELFLQLQDRDFLQSGILVPVTLPSTRTSAVDPPLPDTVGSDAAAAAPIPVPVDLLRQDVNKQLFGTWLSITYLALAQLGLRHPEAGRKLGWAWAGLGDAVEAIGVERFVRASLEHVRRGWRQQQQQQQEQGEDGVQDAGSDAQAAAGLAAMRSPYSMTWGGGGSGVSGFTDSAAPAAPEWGEASGPVLRGGVGAEAGQEGRDGKGDASFSGEVEAEAEDDPLARWLEQRPEVQGMLEEEREAAAAQFLNENKLRGKPAPVLVKVEDEALAATSSALHVLEQQAALVEAAHRLVQGLRST